MKIINAVAKSVPGPHKVDLKNPDKTIVVEIVKVRKFFFLSKLKICAHFSSVVTIFQFILSLNGSQRVFGFIFFLSCKSFLPPRDSFSLVNDLHTKCDTRCFPFYFSLLYTGCHCSSYHFYLLCVFG